MSTHLEIRAQLCYPFRIAYNIPTAMAYNLVIFIMDIVVSYSRLCNRFNRSTGLSIPTLVIRDNKQYTAKLLMWMSIVWLLLPF